MLNDMTVTAAISTLRDALKEDATLRQAFEDCISGVLSEGLFGQKIKHVESISHLIVNRVIG